MTAPLFHLEPGALTGAAPGAEVSFGGPEARHAAAAPDDAVRGGVDGAQALVHDHRLLG